MITGAGAGEVLVRVQAFSICSVDRGALRGRALCLRSLVYRGHVTVGRGFAGVVLDVGPGVLDLELGDEVWGCVSEWSGGAATELLTIRRSLTARVTHTSSHSVTVFITKILSFACGFAHTIRISVIPFVNRLKSNH